MKKLTAFLVIVFWLCSTAFAVMTNSVSQWGITWTFDKQYLVGTFANGDYWVLGPVTITSITPAFTGTQNGWEVNPVVAGNQGFDSREPSAGFSASLVPALPYTASGKKSICKVVSQAVGSGGDIYPFKTAAVLTVVDSLPPDSGKTVFRPAYVGTAKPFYSVNNLHTEWLPSYTPTANAVSLSWIVGKYQHVQFEHKSPPRDFRPTDNYQASDPYGSTVGINLADGALGLMLNNTVQAKMPALIAYVQGGIDRYHMMLNGQTWGGGQGYEPNVKLPLYFMAALFNNPTIIHNVQAFTSSTDNGELYRGKNGVVLFGDTDYYGDPETKYWGNLANGGVGNYEYRDPYGLIDGGFPVDVYQICCLSQPWKGQALAVRLMPAMRAIYADTLLLEYVDRWITVGAWTQPDTCAPLTQASHGSNGHSGCIRDNNSADGVGRYPDQHGANKDDGYYGSSFVASMWTAYRNTVGIQTPAMTDKTQAERVIFPNPIHAALFCQYLQLNKYFKVYDLAGNPVDHNRLYQPGIYLINTINDGAVQKVVVVK